MTNQAQPESRTGLRIWQIEALERTLRTKKYGRLIDTKRGHSYGKYEAAARVGEAMTSILTSHFSQEGLPVHFTLLGSRWPNAYAIWQRTFETICLTSTMVQRIEALAGSVAAYLTEGSHDGNGFEFITDFELQRTEREAALKGLFVQGAVAFLIGHEAGHLAAGHSPILIEGAQSAPQAGSRRKPIGLVLDQFAVARAATGQVSSTKSPLRLNAHEVDADVQGIALLGTCWTLMQRELQASSDFSPTSDLIHAAIATPERMLLLASIGTAIALSQFGFDTFGVSWNRQPSHPLTAVRCVVGLGALGKFIVDPEKGSSLELRPECIEALEITHQVLARLLLRAADLERTSTPFEEQLRAATPEVRTQLMLRATGMETAVGDMASIATYLSELRAEFDSCAKLRQPHIRVNEDTLLPWGLFLSTAPKDVGLRS